MSHGYAFGLASRTGREQQICHVLRNHRRHVSRHGYMRQVVLVEKRTVAPLESRPHEVGCEQGRARLEM